MKKRGRLIGLGLLLIFLLPYLVAKSLLQGLHYFDIPWLIGKPSHHGTLVNPPVSLLDLHPKFQEAHKKRIWLLIYYHAHGCQPLKVCERAWKKLENLFLISGQPKKRLQFDLIDKKNYFTRPLPVDLSTDSFWIVDPNGYLVLYYPSTVGIQMMHQDLKQLLKASRIG